ncbi:MAG: EAL domain-containing protein [Magnetococcales bacterium]|nr:EAL domain-containing protein [Magnetococcales bacterium]NGZ27272.1 EAL domain-containing protein [Magnetococcales bacterium]
MDNPDTKPAILVVDDSPNNVRLLSRILGNGYRVLFATNGPDALAIVQSQRPDLVLLDLKMPGMDGFAVCRALQDHPATADIPIVLVTGVQDPEVESNGFSCGAVDFITKPVNPQVVRARVKTHLAIKKQREALEETNLKLTKEVQDRQRLEVQLREQAEFDSLTGLPNRKLFHDRLEQATLTGERNERSFALLFLDLDRFKWVNDTLGHDAGDELLIEAATRLKGVLRKSDSLARLGGDEFTVMLPDILHESYAELVGRKILEQLSQPFFLTKGEVTVSGSVGIAIFPYDGMTAGELIKNADAAMYQAKAAGRNDLRFFSKEINDRAHRRMQLEADMRKALLRDEFLLDYQPKVDILSGDIVGMEALLRWDHPHHGILFPKDFISLAEETGLIIQIGAWVLKKACQDAIHWAEAGFPHLKMSVNLSALQFRDGEKLIELLEDTLAETGFPPQLLELEITESLMMKDVEGISAILLRLRAMGITFSMDDFGTGYSSLALLKRLPIHVLKIDRSFIHDLAMDGNNTVFISAIISMAKQLGLRVVAEGVENTEQLEILRHQGGDEVQGYLFSPPLGQLAFTELLRGGIPMGGGQE